MTIYTIGHSTRTEIEFLALLQEFGIERLVDVRAYPSSRHNPQFNRDYLETRLPLLGVDYVWMGKKLGGFRPKAKGPAESSPNAGWESPSFRNYADYMLTDAFQEAAARLAALALDRPTAFMCAEKLFSRCHRQMISDYLLCQGWEVRHIVDTGVLKSHSLTPMARCEAGRLTYPGEAKLL
jgi:uncharacterized protein (DUF488 family)